MLNRDIVDPFLDASISVIRLDRLYRLAFGAVVNQLYRPLLPLTGRCDDSLGNDLGVGFAGFSGQQFGLILELDGRILPQQFPQPLGELGIPTFSLFLAIH